MNIKIAQNKNASRVFINIGKNSQIRLRQPVVEYLKLSKGDYILVGTDEKESDPKWLYLLKANGKDYRGYKVSNANGAHHFSAISLVQQFKLEHPKAYPYEEFEDEGVKYVRIKIK